jgi:hypothetical protein
MTRTLQSFVEHTNFDLPHHIVFWNAVERALPAGSLDADGRLGSIWDNAVPIKQPPLTPAQHGEWVTKIKALNLSQPDAYTCQAACIGMAVGDKDIPKIRRNLLAQGEAGSPAVMGSVIRAYGRPYKYEGNASLAQVYEWLKAGEFLITHGWFTSSGHVICLDGLKARATSNRHDLNVKDPWSEFNAVKWLYDKASKFYDGFYSDRLIYATCVAGAGSLNAKRIYDSGIVDTAKGGMWVHRFLV